MIPFLNAGQISIALPYPTLVESLRLAFRRGAEAPRRHVHPISPDNDAVLLLMPVWQPERHTGVKIVTVAPRNPQRGLSSVHSIFMLLNSTTGAPICLMDGEELTLRRTAASSALASEYLSRPDSHHLLMVGTGSLAPYMAAAHCAVRSINTVTVWGRSAEKAARTAALLQQQLEANRIQAKVQITADLETSVKSADIISCATTSTTPIIQGSWVQPGTHIDLVGGFRPNMREADDALMCSAAVFVDTWNGALAEAGDLVQPMEAGKLARADLQAELADLCAGRHQGRSSLQQVTLFKSVGAALEDLCAADLVWDHHQGQAAP